MGCLSDFSCQTAHEYRNQIYVAKYFFTSPKFILLLKIDEHGEYGNDSEDGIPRFTSPFPREGHLYLRRGH